MLTVDQSNYANIQQAIATIATTGQNTISFNSNSIKIGEVPSPDDIGHQDPVTQVFDASYPFFSVRQGKIVGFATGVDFNGGLDAGERGIMQVEPVWEFDCYVFYPYDVKVPNYDKVATALVTMTQLFLQNYNLNQTCAMSNPHSWSMPYAQIGNTQLVAAKWTLKVFEILSANYS